MAVLQCGECEAKVESNRCCGTPMDAQGPMLICGSCQKEVSINRCCGQTMKPL